MKAGKEKIGQKLLNEGQIKPHQIDNIIQRQQCGDKRRFGDIAVALKYISRNELENIIDDKTVEINETEITNALL